MYRQHPLVLIGPLVAGLVLVSFGLWLSILSGWLGPLLLVPAGLLVIGWRLVRWWTFRVRIEGRQVMIRSFGWFVAYERVVSLNAPGGVRLRQNAAGWFWNYGTLQIEVFGQPVYVRYLTPYRRLQRQIDGQ